MQTVFSFTQSLMNGTVTMRSEVFLFGSLELAEQTLADIKAENAKRDLGNLSVRYSKIKTSNVFETKDEIPFYKLKKEG